MTSFTQYRRKQIAELRPWQFGDDMLGISVSTEDFKAGSPKTGDMIARNPKNHADQWLVAAAYFADNFEPAAATPSKAEGGRGEPVAWRYRFVTSMQRDWSDWFIVDDAKSIPNRPLPDVEIQPLYTHPASPPDVEAIRADERERCARIAEGHSVGNDDEFDEADMGGVIRARQIASAIRTGGQK